MYLINSINIQGKLSYYYSDSLQNLSQGIFTIITEILKWNESFHSQIQNKKML